jgi:hypothetical protein
MGTDRTGVYLYRRRRRTRRSAGHILVDGRFNGAGLGRDQRAALDLAEAVGDTAAGQIIWGELDDDAVSGQDADEVLAHLAGQVTEYGMTVLELNGEHRVRQRGDDASVDRDRVRVFPTPPIFCRGVRIDRWSLRWTGWTLWLPRQRLPPVVVACDPHVPAWGRGNSLVSQFQARCTTEQRRGLG